LFNTNRYAISATVRKSEYNWHLVQPKRNTFTYGVNNRISSDNVYFRKLIFRLNEQHLC